MSKSCWGFVFLGFIEKKREYFEVGNDKLEGASGQEAFIDSTDQKTLFTLHAFTLTQVLLHSSLFTR
jgi:hypothetical protein